MFLHSVDNIRPSFPFSVIRVRATFSLNSQNYCPLPCHAVFCMLACSVHSPSGQRERELEKNISRPCSGQKGLCGLPLASLSRCICCYSNHLLRIAAKKSARCRHISQPVCRFQEKTKSFKLSSSVVLLTQEGMFSFSLFFRWHS